MVREGFFKRFYLLFVFIVIFLFLSFGSCLIEVVERPFVKYNIGDEIEFVFLIKEERSVADYVEVDLVCGEKIKNVFRNFASFVDEKNREFSVFFLIEEEGDCFFDVSFLNDSFMSESFEVVSEIFVDVSLNKKSFLPGDEVVISGRVYKANSEVFDYFSDVSVGDFYRNRFSFNDGDFDVGFVLDKAVLAGVYEVLVVFEEKDFSSKVINKGIFRDNISVLSSVLGLEVVFEKEVFPGSNLSFVVNVFNDDGDLIEGEDVEFQIFDSKGNLYYDSVVSSGEGSIVFFEEGLVSGDWRVYANYDDFSFEESFFVGEKNNVMVEFNNESSYVVFYNKGNSFFSDSVELFLINDSGEKVISYDLSLGAGESVKKEIGYSGFYDLRFGEDIFEGVYISKKFSFFGFIFNFLFWLILLFFIVLFFGILFYFGYYYFFVVRENAGNSFDRSVKKKVYSSEGKNRFFNSSKKEEMAVEKSSLKRVIHLRDDSFDDIFSEVEKTGDIGSGSFDLKSSNFDIPVVKNALVESSKEFLGGEKKKKNIDLNVSRVYCLFFRKSDSKEVASVLQRYRMGYYRSGEMRFSLFRSSKPAEKMLFNLCKVIVSKTDNKDVLFHSMSLEESKNLSRFFRGFSDFLREGEGIIISERIYAKLDNKIDFSFFKNYNDNGNLIRFYRFDG